MEEARWFHRPGAKAIPKIDIEIAAVSSPPQLTTGKPSASAAVTITTYTGRIDCTVLTRSGLPHVAFALFVTP